MRHSTTFLMSLIVASILVLMFLNLVLGSVSIPLKSVWNIICGLGDEPVTWQNIVWKSRLPQALTALVAGSGPGDKRLADADCFPESTGGTFCAGDQLWCEHGRGLCGTAER